ncbi:hypothetical protein vBSmQDWS359_52 [Stenotrophomonas phage vB_Sm_QDWS359]|uniref:Uncharacterized protein n=1 Tax=Stenotrophomonas phage vB_Sm_QDWS359 TaxID=2943841 RepID=A0A9E7IXG0_9CAUD|nr:hypothetical protein P9A46_gp70 [Stenotrophomonas phage vB_Sm_QDWS359]UQM93890.1 hypothetical protein vBSmQDWS359_52 [Stenotrophomonas phage vB_Sm_QDWS359]
MTNEAKKPLSIAGLIRVSIENKLEIRNGKRVNISGPHYKIVQSVAAHIKGEGDDAKSYSGKGLDELEITLLDCLGAVRAAQNKREG